MFYECVGGPRAKKRTLSNLFQPLAEKVEALLEKDHM